MNYFGKFDATVSDALGQHPSARLFSESVHATHAPADAVVVSDAQLLFNAEFKRAGVDLVLSGDGREVVLHDYFKGQTRAPIASPDGAHLTGDIVTALAGEIQLAQADGSAGAHTVIGHVTKLVGSATAVRNGVSIILNNGDNVEKGDVVASGSDSTVGITFIDGTVFGLSSNARMVLNEMVYDPNGSNNSSLLSLVAGTITFVAGETAKHGDMKVDTPVATMGIRGTAVLVEIDFAVPAQNAQPGAPVLPDAKFQVLVEPDGTTGSYILFDKQTLTPLAVVDQAGMQINISNGILSQTLAPLSPEIQKLITDVFSLKFSDSSNTKSIEHFTDTIVPTDAFGPIKIAGLTPNLPVTVTITTLNTDTSNSPSVPPALPPHFPNVLHIATTSGTIIQRAGVAGAGQDTVSGTINFVDGNPLDRPTVSTQFSSFSLHNAQGQDISGTLTAQQLSAVEAALILTANPGNNNNGVDTWTYSVPASALSFLTAGETLTLTYNATVNNNFGPADETVTAPITITIKTSGEIWSETHEIASPAPGDWYNGANWQTGVAPNPSDDVIIVTDPTKSGTPFYAVTIKDGGAPASADSVTMNDLGETPPELDNYNTGDTEANIAGLSIGSGGLHMNADSILKNFGTISIGGIAEILQHSVLQNSGSLAHLTLEQGGDFADSSSITNSGKIELAGGTLNVDVDIANKGGTIIVDAGIHNVLELNGATISDGTLTNDGTVGSTGDSALDNVAITNSGTLGATSGVLTIDPAVSGPSLNNSGAVEADGGELDITNEPVTNTGTLLATADSLLKLTSTTVTNTDGAVIVDPGSALDLVTAEIDNGTLTNNGTLNSTGHSTLSDVAITNSGTLESTSGLLTIVQNVDPTVANTGTLEANGGELDITNEPVTNNGTLQAIDESVLKLTSTTVTNTGGTVNVDGDSELDLISAEIDNGTLTNNGTLNSTGTSTLSDVAITNAGTLESTSGLLTIVQNVDPTVTNTGTLEANGGELDITNEPVTNTGTLQAIDESVLKLTSTTVTNTGGTVNVDGDSELDLISAEIDNGNMTIGAGSIVDVESLGGSTLDGVIVTGTSGEVPSTIEIGMSGAATLLLDDGTTITNGKLTIAAGSTLDVEAGAKGPGATLHGVNVTNFGTIQVDGPGSTTTVTLVLDGGMTISGGKLIIHEPPSPDQGIVEIKYGGATFDDVTVTNNNELIIDAAVTLTLTDNTSILGGTIDDAGILLVSSASEIENATVDGGGDVTVTGGTLTLSGVTLDNVTLAGSFTNADTLTIDETVTLNGATLSGGTIDDNGTLVGFGTINSVVAGPGELTASGGTLTLTGDNTYGGVTTIDGGSTLALSGTGSIANSSDVIDDGTFDISKTSAGASIVTLSGDGTVKLGAQTLTLTQGSTTFDGAINGSGGLTVDGSGTETLTGDNTYSGVTTIGSGETLALSGTGSIADSSNVVDNGTFDISKTSTGASIVTLSGNGAVKLGAQTLTLTKGSTTFDGAINGSGGLTVEGSGTETLTGDNTYTGATTIGSGETLALSGTGSIADSSDVVDDGTFDISKTSAGASIVTLSGNGAVKLGSKTLTLSNASTTFSGAIGGTGGLTLLAGMLILTGDSNYSGTTTISGTLALSGTGSIADSGNVIDHGTFDISGLTTGGTSIVTLSGDGTVKLGNNTLTLSDASTTFSGTIGGAGGLTLTTGSEILTGNNKYSGTTTINGGTLALSGTGSIASSNGVVDNGSFDISGLTAGTSITTLSGTGKVNLGGNTLTLTAGAGTFSGVISGGGGLTVDGTGTETLTGVNTYTGATAIGSGETLALSGTGSIAKSSGVADNGTFDISGLTAGTSITTLSGTGKVNLGSNTLTLTAGVGTFSGVISGGGGLTVDGTGTETLAGVNTYTGATTIGSGETLALSGSGSIAKSSGVADNGAFDISGLTAGTSITTLSGTGKVILGSKTLTLTAGAGTFSGVISGSGGLTVDGTGTETLAGVNTYTGATTIGSGETLALSGTGSIAKSSGVADNGTFDISTTTLGASIVTLSGNGALKLGNETLTLTHASTAFDGTISSTGGGITVAGGTLTLGTMTLDDLTLAGSFSNSGTLTVNHTVTLNGASIDGGTLDISGILDSTGVSTISDATIINPGHIDVVSGTLTIDPTPFTNTGTFEVGSSAVLSGEAITDTQGNVISVLQEVVTNTNGKIQIDQGGTLTLFDTTINGGTIIDHGTLLITGTTNKLENVTFSGNAALDISNNTSLELGGSDFSGVTVNFGTPGPKGNVVSTSGLLILDDSHHFSGTIEGLVENSDEGLENHVDLTDLAWHQGQMHVSYSNGEVTVSYRDDHKTIDSVTLNVSGTSGDFEISSDGHGGTLLDDPATTGTVTIDSNQVLGISAATSATISFTNSTGNTGELLLNDSHDFTGTIAGFAGDGTIANSDLIDIADVNFANVATDKTTYTENADGTGTLTLYNANGQALDSLNFNGTYQLANFTIESDGNGGTLIVDPPVNTSTQTPANTVVASGPNQVLSGAAPADNFVFNFAAVGHSAIANFNPAADMIQFSNSVFANVQSILNAVHDDGHGNSVIAIDAHDSITLNGVSKAQLHANDFHVV